MNSGDVVTWVLLFLGLVALYRAYRDVRSDLQRLSRAAHIASERPGGAEESPVEADRLFSSLSAPVPYPAQAPRLVSPSRARRNLERKLAEKARARDVLVRAEKEQAG